MTIYDLIDELVVKNKGDLSLETLKVWAKRRQFDDIPADIELIAAIESTKRKWQISPKDLANKVARKKREIQIWNISTCG